MSQYPYFIDCGEGLEGALNWSQLVQLFRQRYGLSTDIDPEGNLRYNEHWNTWRTYTMRRIYFHDARFITLALLQVQ